MYVWNVRVYCMRESNSMTREVHHAMHSTQRRAKASSSSLFSGRGYFAMKASSASRPSNLARPRADCQYFLLPPRSPGHRPLALPPPFAWPSFDELLTLGTETGADGGGGGVGRLRAMGTETRSDVAPVRSASILAAVALNSSCRCRSRSAAASFCFFCNGTCNQGGGAPGCWQYTIVLGAGGGGGCNGGGGANTCPGGGCVGCSGTKGGAPPLHGGTGTDGAAVFEDGGTGTDGDAWRAWRGVLGT